MGLQLLADETHAELMRGGLLSQPAGANVVASREWLWYAVAAAILALGVLGYLWK